MAHEKRHSPHLKTIDQLRRNASGTAEWLHTDEAAAFIAAIADAGLEFTEAAKDQMTTEYDARYGRAYSWLTRDVAMTIHGRRRRNGVAQNIVTTEYEWDPDAEDDIAKPLHLERVEQTGNPGADLLIDLMQQAQHTSDESDVPVTEFASGFKNGSCKDAEAFYIKAANGRAYGQGHLAQFRIGTKIFLKKTLGAETYLNLEPLVFNGVSLPPGCLFRRHPNDDKLQLLRVSGFAFDETTALELFGSQITDHYDEKDGEKEVAYAFEKFAQIRDAWAEQNRTNSP